jgi:transcriptional regulator with GAF, ATPase, and Fis domain
MKEYEHRNLNALIELASLLSQQSDFQEIVRLIVQKASTTVKSDIALIMMLNPKTRETVKTIYAKGKELHDKKYHFVHTNISGWVIKNKLSFHSRNIQSDKRFQKNLFKDTGIKSAICVPLCIEAIINGTLLLLNKSGQAFTEDDLDILEKLAGIASPFLRDVQKIQEFFVTPLPRQTLLRKYESFGMLGKSKKFIELLQSIEAASRSSVRILLEGESGTGKELVARAIHKLSSRSQNKFLALDCDTIPASLIESELFGHVKGAFTGAAAPHRGILEEAHGGTLFMDEINNLPLEMQTKFLRFLQEGEIRPLGSNRVHKVDVRIIAASSISLGELVDKQQFREDLFYRLNVYPIRIPPLNERRDDIPLLAVYFIRRFSGQQNKQAESFQGILLDFIRQRNWKGNIRELENFIERLVTLAPAAMKMLEAKILPAEFQKELQKFVKIDQTIPESRSLGESLAEYEEKLIRSVLIECNWNQSKAARVLKISEHAIRYKMKKLGIKKQLH